jgi:peptidoglycan/LPS O-acetylase OafA/YrhL
MALIVFYFVIPLFIKQPPVSVYQGEYMYWFYLQNIADTFNWNTYGPQHFWSLAVEEHFYLFWPLVVYFTSKKGLVRFIVFVVFMALVCRCLLIYNGYGTFYFTFSVMDGLAIGAFLAWLESAGKLQAVKFNLLIIGSLVLLICTWVFVGGKAYDWVQEIKFPIIAVFYMAVIGKLISAKGWLNKVFSSNGLRFTGKISYGLYVFHPMCYGIYYHFFGGNNIWINALVCFSFSYIIATISFYAFEIHFIKLKRYFEPANWAKKQEMQFE